MADPRDRRSYSQRQAVRQRAKRMVRQRKRQRTKAEWAQIIFVIALIIVIVIGSIFFADSL